MFHHHEKKKQPNSKQRPTDSRLTDSYSHRIQIDMSEDSYREIEI